MTTIDVARDLDRALPKIKGASEKQVSYADEVRFGLLYHAVVTDQDAKLDLKDDPSDQFAARQVAAADAAKKLAANDLASFWLDTKQLGARKVAEVAAGQFEDGDWNLGEKARYANIFRAIRTVAEAAGTLEQFKASARKPGA